MKDLGRYPMVDARARVGSIRSCSRGTVTVATVVALVAGMFVGPASAGTEPGPDGRARCVELMKVGGPAVSRAAEAALLGSDDDLREFLRAGYQEARDQDDRVRVEQFLSTGGSAVKEAGEAALAGSPAAV